MESSHIYINELSACPKDMSKKRYDNDFLFRDGVTDINVKSFHRLVIIPQSLQTMTIITGTREKLLRDYSAEGGN